MTDNEKMIVVVDDDTHLNLALIRFLTAAGYRTQTYHSAEEFFTSDPEIGDCFIFDVNLPGMSGFELLRKLRRSGNKTPAIFITAYDDPAYHKHAKDSGGAECINKPFPARKLLSAITSILSPKSLNNSLSLDGCLQDDEKFA